ncbi:hypothetical protein PR048_024567 [Dryococelus australis]|uniref:Uncharacterized protein n=1 Tax=Dryococelus australis TaxID=614101 RepID=A0ABQ9GNY6_9NEOP|nr:hypothetical protein PR048_024567 [Dryococelus australis]
MDDRIMLSSQLHERQIQCLTSSLERDSAEENTRKNETCLSTTMSHNSPHQQQLMTTAHPSAAIWDPRKEKTFEEHLSDVYEHTCHLTAAMSEEEFVDVVFSQLPIMYQRQFSSGVYRDLTEFRHHLICADQLKRQARSTNTARENNSVT